MYLLQIQHLAGVAGSDADFITSQEWADARDVVVAAYRRLEQPLWRQQEVTANCLLGPDAFQINGTGPRLGTYRAETTARQDGSAYSPPDLPRTPRSAHRPAHCWPPPKAPHCRSCATLCSTTSQSSSAAGPPGSRSGTC